MKGFRDIIQDIKAPSTSDLWINNGSSDVYTLPGVFQTTEDKYFAYLISEDLVILLISGTVLFANSVVDNLNSLETKQPLSAKQGKILNDRVTELESKSNVAVLTPTGTKLMELVSSSPNVTQEQLAEAGFTPEICRRLNAGEVIYMSGECAGFGNGALYPIQGIAPNSSPDLVPSRLCYCHYSSYSVDGTANGGCFTTIKKQSSGQYLVDYIEL